MTALMNETANCTLITANKTAAIASIEGYINFDTSEEVYIFITSVLDEHGSRFLILDASRVEYVSSAGIGVFMSLQDRMEGVNGSIILVGVQEAFRHVLELVGAVEYFVFCPTMQAAREHVLSLG